MTAQIKTTAAIPIRSPRRDFRAGDAIEADPGALPETGGIEGVTTVVRDIGALTAIGGSGPDCMADHISRALCQRSCTDSCRAFITTRSTLAVTCGASCRSGTNWLGIAIRSVAVGGACPVNR